LADGYFRSYEYEGDIFMLKYLPQKLQLLIQVYRFDSLVDRITLTTPKSYELVGSISLGKTSNSNGKEIISAVFSLPDTPLTVNYLLLTWDGKKLNKSGIELADDALITDKYKNSISYGLICGNRVNIRSEPSLDAEVIATCNKHTRVTVDLIEPRYVRIGAHYQKWQKVKWQNKSGFVLDEFIDIPLRYIMSNYSINISFLLTSGGIYVYKNNDIIATYNFPYKDQSSDYFYNFGHYGLKKNIEILGVCKRANSCGEYGGDNLYVWDGKKIKYMGSDGGIGDGGYSNGVELVFPANLEGEESKIIETDYAADYNEYELLSNPCEQSGKSIYSYFNKRVLVYENDTLVEIASPDLALRSNLKKLYPKLDLLKYDFLKLNNDSLYDAVFVLGKKDDYESKINPILGIAFAKDSNTFNDIKVNHSLINKLDYTLCNTSNDGQLTIWVLSNLGSEFSESETSLVKQYIFRVETNNRVVWDCLCSEQHSGMGFLS
jgi:hypothetical protein